MSRPNTEMINNFKLIESFKKYVHILFIILNVKLTITLVIKSFCQNSENIKTIVNLQEVGEHSSCGPPLDQSGFSYDPKVFMDNESAYLYRYTFY